ncbi:MAG: hypothetical protein IJ050_07690, partial [Clostridia bacterium]|nr:hypothetical protein [Clostridia bacterium]
GAIIKRPQIYRDFSPRIGDNLSLAKTQQTVIQRNAYMRSLRRFSQSHLQFQKLLFYKSHGDFVRFFPTPNS